LNLLEAVLILSIGSSEEYGNVAQEDLPLKEDHLIMPVSPYAVARVSQELLSQIYTNGYGLDIVMTRSFNHIGPLQKDIFVIPSFVKQLLKIKNTRCNGDLISWDLAIVRDFTDVRDVVGAYYRLLTQGKKGDVYNICSGKGLSLRQVLEKLCNILDINVNVVVDRNLIRPSDNRIIIGSNEKIKMNHGWEPRYSLENSLNDMIKYWQRKDL
jgi:GDP-4-dehydro-6-deoxy-D-mannose reductase